MLLLSLTEVDHLLSLPVEWIVVEQGDGIDSNGSMIRVGERMDAWMGGWVDGWTDGWMDGHTDGRVDGRTDGRMDGWTDR